MSRTPGPWEYGKAVGLYNPPLFDIGAKKSSMWIATVGNTSEEEAKANARFIVQACNCHAKLVEALEAVQSHVQNILNAWADSNVQNPEQDSQMRELTAINLRIDAALAAAKEAPCTT